MSTTSITIEQRIAAASQFDGNAPNGAATVDATTGITKYAAGTAGGLFTFGFGSLWLMEVQRIVGDFANAATVKVAIRNTDGDEFTVYSGTVGGDLVITDRIQLAPDEKVVIVTTGATQAMVARVILRPLMMAPA